MHVIEPFYSWRHHYIAAEDPKSPFYGRIYSEMEFSHAIYNYLIHPQWDLFGSATLVAKVLYAGYDYGFAVIELLGEWNDTLYNDIMYLKNNLINPMLENHIDKYVLIGENVLNFHGSEEDYYQEWYDDIQPGGYIFANGFQDHVIREFMAEGLDEYIIIPDYEEEVPDWRNYEPLNLKRLIEKRNLLK